MRMSKGLLASVATVGLSLGAGTAHAALSVSSSVGGAPTVPGVARWNLDSFGDVPAVVSAVTLVGTAGFVTGSKSGEYAAPYLSGSNGIGFGPGGTNQGGGVDTTQYLTSGSTVAATGSRVEIAFNTGLQYLGLLWGSVDTYNTLAFFLGDTSVGSLTGSDVIGLANGNQGVNGTVYANINSTLKFDRIVFTSAGYAFEFDNLAFSETPINPVPIPAAAWLLVSGLLGLFGISRRGAAS